MIPLFARITRQAFRRALPAAAAAARERAERGIRPVLQRTFAAAAAGACAALALGGACVTLALLLHRYADLSPELCAGLVSLAPAACALLAARAAGFRFPRGARHRPKRRTAAAPVPLRPVIVNPLPARRR